MKLVQVNGPLGQLDPFLLACCTDGNFAPEPAMQYMSASLGYITLSEDNPYPAIVQQFESLASQLGRTLSPAETNHPIELSDAHNLIDEINRRFKKLNAARNDLMEQRQMCLDGAEQYNHFKGLDANIEQVTGCDYVSVRFGFLPLAGYQELTLHYADDPYIVFMPCKQDKNGYWGVYFTPKDRQQETDAVFSLLYFERVMVPGAAGTPEEIIHNFEENIELIDKQLAQMDATIASMWDEQADKINEIYNAARYHAAMFELRRYAAYKDDVFVYTGWIPATYEKQFNKEIKGISDVRVSISDPENSGSRNTPPTKLKNHFWSKPFEFFVEMYGLPSYGETDITAFVAITYVLLFGIMFADVGQGAVLAIASYLIWKIKKMPLFRLMIPCGICSCIVGFVFGSVFGYEEALDPLYHAIGLPGKPVSVMDSINGILLLAIGIGVVMVAIAMVIYMYSSIRKHLWGEVIFSNNGLVGLLTYAAGVSLCTGFMNGPAFLPGGVAIAIVVVGLILLLMKEVLIPLVDGEDWHPEGGWGNYFMQNIFELLEYVLSYLSNTISFLRVGAFVFVHASMMMVVFKLAGDPANIIIVALGNALVLVLEALLSGIQGLRLEFYEMFSRCYEGGGRPFRGFDIHRQLSADKAA